MARLEQRRAAAQRLVARFSVGWLFAANAVGAWLAAVLLWPSLGDALGPLSYGRWMPLHMDWQLYGWCALPLLGLIMRRYWDHDDSVERRTRFGLWLWSAGLMVSGASWLLGQASGKPFLEWTGFARWFFPLCLIVVWGEVVRGWRERRAGVAVGTLSRWGDGAFVALLLSAPVSLFALSDPSIYPPVDPASGGATGHSLMLSTLGIAAIIGLLPSWGLGLRKREPSGRDFREHVFWSVWLCSIGGYVALRHGDVSNRSLDQVIGLGSLMLWPPLTFWLWRGRVWSDFSRVWRTWFFVWWFALAISGWLLFLPEALDRLKFTNALVGHAHLAMAGLVTAMNAALLIEMGADSGVRRALGERSVAFAWNVALLVFVVDLAAQGWVEGADPARLFLFDAGSAWRYGIRFVAGLAMLGCSGVWLWRLLIRTKDLKCA